MKNKQHCLNKCQDKFKLTRLDYFFAEAVRTLWLGKTGYDTDFPDMLVEEALTIAKAMEKRRR